MYGLTPYHIFEEIGRLMAGKAMAFDEESKAQPCHDQANPAARLLLRIRQWKPVPMHEAQDAQQDNGCGTGWALAPTAILEGDDC